MPEEQEQVLRGGTPKEGNKRAELTYPAKMPWPDSPYPGLSAVEMLFIMLPFDPCSITSRTTCLVTMSNAS